MSKNGKGWCHWLDPMNFIPVSKGNLYQMRRFCGISKDRQALSSPDTHQKPRWFTRNNMARDEWGSFTQHLQLASHQNKTFLCFSLGFFSFNSCTSKSQQRWEEPRAWSEKTVHSSPGAGGRRKSEQTFKLDKPVPNIYLLWRTSFIYAKLIAHSLLKIHLPEEVWLNKGKENIPGASI